MRHNNSINPLGRKSAHRSAMLTNMAASLIMHKRIKTTLAKAKALRVYIEPVLTSSKEDSTHARRLAFSYLQDKDAVTELFREVSPKIATRPGGYTRILKLGTRPGDAAEICYIELVDFNEAMLEAKEGGDAKSKRRSRRGSKKKVEEAVVSVKKSKTSAKAGKPAAGEENKNVIDKHAADTTNEVDGAAKGTDVAKPDTTEDISDETKEK